MVLRLLRCCGVTAGSGASATGTFGVAPGFGPDWISPFSSIWHTSGTSGVPSGGTSAPVTPPITAPIGAVRQVVQHLQW